ncbi:MAG: hypothetical protein C5B51_01635 [Terriglobia bacterium]|nr:MAG: hypothetical protein C5B51_01635 [Terriglobia bacterium]
MFVKTCLILLCVLRAGMAQCVYPVGNTRVRPTQSASGNGYLIKQGFGPDSNGHTGVDLANGQEGGEVRAACQGTVVEVRIDTSGKNQGFGNMVRISHQITGIGTIYSQYGHLKNGSVTVATGQSVDVNTVIGNVDCSGYTLGKTICPSNGKKGPHLHFAIQLINRGGCGYLPDSRCPNDTFSLYYDPLQFVADHSAQSGTLSIGALLDGKRWPDTGMTQLNYTIVNSNGQSLNGTGIVPTTIAGVAPDSYKLLYSSGGPAAFTGISPSATQTLVAGGALSYTLHFSSSPTSQITAFLASTTNSVISFGGGQFTFQHNQGPGDFVITSDINGDGSAAGLTGTIAGAFTIGNITQINPNVQQAPVTGTGTLTITDAGGVSLTGTVDFLDIETVGTGGTLDSAGLLNVTNMVYSGTNGDLLKLAKYGTGVIVGVFQFVPGKTVTDLKNAPADSPLQTSFAASVTSVQ